MDVTEQVEQLTIEEYVRLYEREGPFEIIDGERRSLMPPVLIHVLAIRTLFRLLDAYCVANRLGEVITEMPFVLTYNADWVKGSRVPALMFITAARWEQYVKQTPDRQYKPIILVPDLVVEVVSPNDLYSEIQNKVDHYLADGVRLIWVFDPQRSRVSVYEGERFATLGEDAILSGGEVIPGFETQLAEFFQSVGENS